MLASNRAAHDLFGLSRAVLNTKRIGELVHPDDLDRDPLALRNLAAGMTLRSVRRLRRQGHNGWIWPSYPPDVSRMASFRRPPAT